MSTKIIEEVNNDPKIIEKILEEITAYDDKTLIDQVAVGKNLIVQKTKLTEQVLKMADTIDALTIDNHRLKCYSNKNTTIDNERHSKRLQRLQKLMLENKRIVDGI